MFIIDSVFKTLSNDALLLRHLAMDEKRYNRFHDDDLIVVDICVGFLRMGLCSMDSKTMECLFYPQFDFSPHSRWGRGTLSLSSAT